MKKMMKQLITLVALMLCGGAWAVAPTPVAIWNGDIADGSEQGGITLSLNGNSIQDGVVTIGSKGILLTTGTNKQTVTIIYKYSHLAVSGTSDVRTLAVMGGGDNDADSYVDYIGIAAKSPTLQMTGIWNGGVYNSKDTNVGGSAQYATHSGTMAFAYSYGSTSRGYLNGELVYNADQALQGSLVYAQKLGVGGKYSGSNACEGMKISSIAVFDSALSADDIKNFTWSEPAETDYSATLSSDKSWAELAWADSKEWANSQNAVATIAVTANAKLTIGAAVTAKKVTLDIAEGVTLTLAGDNAITTIDNIYVTGKGTIKFTNSTNGFTSIGGTNLMMDISPDTTMELNHTGTWDYSGVNFTGLSGSGTVKISGSSWHCAGPNLWSTTLSTKVENGGGWGLRANTANDVFHVANLEGSGHIRSDFNNGTARTLEIIERKNTTWSGKINGGTNINLMKIKGDVASNEKTLTLSGTSTDNNVATIQVENTGSLKLTGTWKTSTLNINGEFGGNGTVNGASAITVANGAVLRADWGATTIPVVPTFGALTDVVVTEIPANNKVKLFAGTSLTQPDGWTTAYARILVGETAQYGTVAVEADGVYATISDDVMTAAIDAAAKYKYEMNGLFENSASGDAALNLGNSASFPPEHFRDNAVLKLETTGHWGDTGFSYGSGNWTIVTAIKAPADNQCVFAMGGQKGTVGMIGLRNAGSNRMVAFTANSTDLCSVTLNVDPTAAFHVYSIVYENGTIKMNVDGGDFSDAVPFGTGTDGKWQIGSIHNGAISGYAAQATSGEMDAWRMYSYPFVKADAYAVTTEFVCAAKINDKRFVSVEDALDAAIADKSLIVTILDGTTTLPEGYEDTCVIENGQAWAKREVYARNTSPYSYHTANNSDESTKVELRTGDTILLHQQLWQGNRWMLSNLNTNYPIKIQDHTDIDSIPKDADVSVEYKNYPETGDKQGIYLRGNIGANAQVSGSGALFLGFTDNSTIADGVTISCDVGFQSTGKHQTLVADATLTLECENYNHVSGSSIKLNSGAKIISDIELPDGAVESNVPGKIVDEEQNSEDKWVYSLIDQPAATVVIDGETRSFTTLAAAISAADAAASSKSPKTVTLSADCSDTLIIPANVVLDTSTYSFTGTVSGSGTIISYGSSSAAPAVPDGVTAGTWSGTVWLKNKANWINIDLNAYGNRVSTVRLTNISGYLTQYANVSPCVELVDEKNGDNTIEALKITNGWSNDIVTLQKIKGKGTLNLSAGPVKMLIKDSSGFEGTAKVTVSGRDSNIGGLIFGNVDKDTLTAGNNSPHNNKITILSGNSVEIASGKTWSATGGMIVNGTISGSGTIDTALTLENNATIDVTGNSENEALTLGANKTLSIGSPVNVIGVSEGSVILNGLSASPENLQLTAVTVGGESVAGAHLYFEDGALKYSAQVAATWAPNEAFIDDNGIFDWSATGVWKDTSGASATWSVTAETEPKPDVTIDATKVKGVKISGQIYVGHVTVRGELGDDESFQFHSSIYAPENEHPVDGEHEVNEEIDCLHAASVNLTELVGELGMKVPITGNIAFGRETHLVFATGAVENPSTAYGYSFVDRGGSIAVEGEGRFVVPSSMFGIPFAVGEDATIVFDIASSEATSSAVISGAGAVAKTGAGTIKFTTANTFTGGLYVEAGEAKTTNGTGFGPNNYDNGQPMAKITVSSGATLDLANLSGTSYDITCAGTLKNSGGDLGTGTRQTPKLTMSGNVTVNGNQFGLLANSWNATSLDMGGNKLTVSLDSGKNFILCNTTVVNPGLIDVTANGLHLNANGAKVKIDASTVNLVNNEFTFIRYPVGTTASTDNLELSNNESRGYMLVAEDNLVKICNPVALVKNDDETVKVCATLDAAFAAVQAGQTVEVFASGTASANISSKVINVVVKNGVVLTAGAANAFGANGSNVTVENGGTINLYGNTGRYNYTIAGSGAEGTDGAITNERSTVSFNGSGIQSLTLTDDATIGGTRWFGFLNDNGGSSINLGGHTLTIATYDSANASQGFVVGSVPTVTGNGKIVIPEGGKLWFYFGGNQYDFSGIDFEVVGKVILPNTANLKVKDLTNATTIAGTVTVNGVLSGAGTYTNLTLGDGATILNPNATNAQTVNGTLTFGASVTLKGPLSTTNSTVFKGVHARPATWPISYYRNAQGSEISSSNFALYFDSSASAIKFCWAGAKIGTKKFKNAADALIDVGEGDFTAIEKITPNASADNSVPDGYCWDSTDHLMVALPNNVKNGISLTSFDITEDFETSGSGGIQTGSLSIAADVTLTIDPIKTPIYVTGGAPTFAAGSQIALASEYDDAKYANGVFTLMTWDGDSTGSEMTLPTLVGHAGASVYLETYTTRMTNNVAAGNEKTYTALKADLNPSVDKTPIKVMPLGDSITEGSNNQAGSFGNPNYRTILMAKLAALGYNPTSIGIRKMKNMNQAGIYQPEQWSWHTGISGECLITKTNRAGYRDSIETLLEACEVPDVICFKIGTNDIMSNNANFDVDREYAAWVDVMNRIIAARPTTKIVVGSIMPYPAGRGEATNVSKWNDKLRDVIAENTPNFPANQVYFADLYTNCPRTEDGQTNFVDDYHPNWIGHEKNAETWVGKVDEAMKAPKLTATYTPNTKLGATANVAPEYLEGFVRIANISASGAALTAESYTEKSTLPEGTKFTKVGYYMELRHKYRLADAPETGHVRWVWVDMDAWGDEGKLDFASLGVPFDYDKQTVVYSLHVDTNDGGITKIAPTVNDQVGWIQFTSKGLNADACGVTGAPDNAFNYDWNDTINTSAHGVMQIFHKDPNYQKPLGGHYDYGMPATTLMAFSRYRTATQEIGIGNCLLHTDPVNAAFDGTKLGAYYESYQYDKLNAAAYDIARIEIWGKPENASTIVTPEEEGVTVETKEAAEAVEIVVNDSEAAKAGQTTALLKKVVVAGTGEQAGKFIVKAELNEAAIVDGRTKTVQAAVEETAVEFAKTGLEAVAGATKTTEVVVPAAKVVPGLYYSVSFGTTPDNHTEESDRVLATGTDVTIPVPKLGDEKVYYIKIKASATK